MRNLNTPWGKADSSEILAPGIISYSTPSHGGIWLAPERQKELNYSKNWLRTPEWWEEDCDWSVPYLYFEKDIRAYEKEKTRGRIPVNTNHINDNIEAARVICERFHPEIYKRLTGSGVDR